MTMALPATWRDLPRTAETGALTRARFEAAIVSPARPHIMRAQVADWPLIAASHTSPQAFCDHLSARATPRPAELWVRAPGAAGPYGYDAALGTLAFERKFAPVAQLCALLLRCLAEPGAPGLFAGAIPLADHLPALLAEAPMTLLDPAQERLNSLWIGTTSRTAAHWDRPANLACPVLGERHFLLFPPEAIGDLYLGPLDLTPAGQAISLVDCEAPDFAAFPRYRGALARAQLASLVPGDTLYLPPLWFHYVVSPAPLGAQVNFWWVAGGAERISPLNTLLHGLLSLRHLPLSERAAWRALFDHYLFEAGAETLAHIPPPARGLLADDDAARARIAARLAQQLAARGRQG